MLTAVMAATTAALLNFPLLAPPTPSLGSGYISWEKDVRKIVVRIRDFQKEGCDTQFEIRS